MTNITYFGLSTFSFNAYGGELTFSSFISSSATTYVFTNSDGVRVTMTGNDIVVDGSNQFVSGIITQITISPRGGSDVDVDVLVTDFEIDGTELLGSGGTNVPSSDAAWRALVAGDVNLTSDADGRIDFGLDGPRFRGTDVLVGDDNTATGDFGITSYLMGSIAYVYDTAIVQSGTFIFNGQARYVLGDVWNSYDDALVIGGDDTLTFDPGTDFPELHANTTINFSGDARSVRDNSILIGGNDVIDLRAAVTSETVFGSGDADSTTSTSRVVGGDDIIRGSTTSNNLLTGDVRSLAETSTFIAGDDTIWGGTGNDEIHGDTTSTVTGISGGDDILYGGTDGTDSLFGGAGRDRIYAGQGDIYVEAGADDDKVFLAGGGEGDVFLDLGDDFVRVNGTGNYQIAGGAGVDRISFTSAEGDLYLDLSAEEGHGGVADGMIISGFEEASSTFDGDATIYGTDGDNNLNTFNGDDRVFGGAGNDDIETGAGDDYIKAGAGENTYDGGDGRDTISYYDSNAGVDIDLKRGEAEGGFAEGDIILDIGRVTGTRFDDKLFGLDGGNILKGGAGDDSFWGRDGTDKIYGGSGSDFLNGGDGTDYLFGGSGRDTFHFDRTEDRDIIRDFQNNADQIEFDGFGSGFDPFEFADQVGDDVVFDLPGSDRLIVEDILLGQLGNDVFVV